jgi:hypothetical protein
MIKTQETCRNCGKALFKVSDDPEDRRYRHVDTKSYLCDTPPDEDGWSKNALPVVFDDEANMDMTHTYPIGSLRACAHDHCKYQVMYSGYDWSHLPKDGIYPGILGHEGVPYPEHKHNLKITRSDDIVHHSKCDICWYESSTSKNLIRYLTTNRWAGL